MTEAPIVVVWTHPAVLDGAERVSNVPASLGSEAEIAEYIARAFLPFGIEGLACLTLRSIT